MARYVLKRILLLIPTLLAVAILIFCLMELVPGDPARMVLGSEASMEDVAVLREAMGLNRPLLTRLGEFLVNTFIRFDWGSSYVSGVNITAEIARRLPRTLTLGFCTFLLTVFIGVPLGVIAAVNQNKIPDRMCMVGALAGVSVPQFWLGLLLVLLFSVRLEWLPSSGCDTPLHYILPCIAGCIGGVANNARQARSATLEVIRSDYVTTARAKGISKGKVIMRHVLPNSLIPILTCCGTALGNVCGGSVVIETVFGIPGIGTYTMTAMNSRDYPVVRTCVVILAAVFAVAMILVDIAYAAVDPRIKAKYASSAARRKKNA